MMIAIGITLVGGGRVGPPAGHIFLRGKNPDGSYTIPRGQTAPAIYRNLNGKAA